MCKECRSLTQSAAFSMLLQSPFGFKSDLGVLLLPGHISTYEDPWRSDIVDMFQNKGYSTPASQTNYFTRSRSVTKIHCRLSGFSAQFWDSTAPACSCEWVCVCVCALVPKKIELSRIETQDKHGLVYIYIYQFHSIPVLIGLTVCWVLPTASIEAVHWEIQWAANLTVLPSSVQ